MKKQGFKLHVGTASILLVFITLCLVSFAILTVTSTNADYKLSKRLYDRTVSYYGAVAAAESFIAETDAALYALSQEMPDEASYLTAISEHFGDTAISKFFEINDVQSLEVTLLPIYPQKDEATLTSSCFVITAYHIITEKTVYEYNENLMQNIP